MYHGRPHQRERDARGREDLLADALRVRVDVGPAPEDGALGAGLDQAVLDELPLHLGELVVERGAAAGLALLAEVVLGLVEERALAEGVARALAGLLHEVEALVDLALRIPVRFLERAVRVGRAVPGLALGPREGDLARIDLFDQARAVARDVAGAGVHHLRAEGAGEVGEVVDAERVDLERLVERRVEVDDAGHVHHGRDVAGELADQIGVDAEVRVDHVAGDGRDLGLQKGFKRRPGVLLAHRIEHRRRGDLRPEALLGGLAFLGPHQQVEVSDLGEAIEHHRHPHLAEEPRPADDAELLACENLRGNEGGGDLVGRRQRIHCSGALAHDLFAHQPVLRGPSRFAPRAGRVKRRVERRSLRGPERRRLSVRSEPARGRNYRSCSGGASVSAFSQRMPGALSVTQRSRTFMASSRWWVATTAKASMRQVPGQDWNEATAPA
jgi:hypothetical protein